MVRLAWLVLVLALAGCTDKWIDRAQMGRGITPAEAARCTNADLGVWPDVPTLDEVCR